MSLRRRALPRGWYPDDPQSLRDLVQSWAGPEPRDATAIAAVAPHAGWSFSGRIAARAAASLAAAPTIAIFGGHLPSSSAPLAAEESSFDSPLGPIEADLELLSALKAHIKLGRDDESDNTVEVLVPIISALFPGSRLLWLRAPNGSASLELGQALFAASRSLGRELACLGSTDLTHYGPNYGFSPKGRGGAAEAWVRDTNDRRFIEALLALDGDEVLRRGEAERSACSSGAAAAALSFALAAGATRAELLEYATSLELRRDESFVGYAAVAFYA